MLKKRWLNVVHMLSVHHPCLSGDVQRCWRWPGRRLFHVALRGSVLIESSHGLSSSGYAHDTVLSDQTVAECDNCLKPNPSVGALNGASYQLLGADMESLNRMGLYLESKMVSECSHSRCLIQHTC